MSDDLPDWVEQHLAQMPEPDFDALIVRVRSPEELTDPRARAARALAKAVGGHPKPKVSKARAAAALADYRRSNR